MTVSVRGLRPDELEAWHDLLEAAFAAKGTPRSHFERHTANDPAGTAEAIRVLVDGERGSQLCSTLRVFRRQMRLADQWVDVGCIGEVATHPDHRRKGYSGLVLADAQSFMTAQGIGLSILHSSQFADFYRKHGWLPIPRVHAEGTLRRDVLNARAAVVTSDLAAIKLEQEVDGSVSETSNQTLKVLQFLHEAKMKGVPGAFRRPDLAYWQRWVLGECSMPKRSLWIAERASAWDRVRGYLVAGVRGRRREAVFQIQELAFHPQADQPEVFACLLHRAVQHHRSQLPDGPITVQYQPGLVPAPLVAPLVDNLVETEDAGWMYRVADREALASAGLGGVRKEGGDVTDEACLSAALTRGNAFSLVDAF